MLSSQAVYASLRCARVPTRTSGFCLARPEPIVCILWTFKMSRVGDEQPVLAWMVDASLTSYSTPRIGVLWNDKFSPAWSVEGVMNSGWWRLHNSCSYSVRPSLSVCHYPKGSLSSWASWKWCELKPSLLEIDRCCKTPYARTSELYYAGSASCHDFTTPRRLRKEVSPRFYKLKTAS